MNPFELLPPQFTNWIKKSDGGKMPCDAQGQAVNHLDPANWRTYAQAAAAGLPVAFVLTANDPYVFIDVDHCRDAATGVWSPEAQDVVARFPGALMEISQSGTGLHIIGVCDQSVMQRKRRKWAGQFECYVADRFVALTGISLQGNPHLDLTLPLMGWVPDRPDPALTGIPDTGPVPEWDGDTDDQMLIQHALSARGGISVQFGNHASFRDLWTGNVPALAKHYPAYKEGAGFDASAADAALVMLLGFWTGKDMARTERLWRAAPLTQGRAKLDRNDYVHATITTGLQKVRQVYRRPPAKGVPAPTGGAPAGMPGVAVAAAPAKHMPGVEAPGYMTIYDQERLFAGCVYVDEDAMILCPDGVMRDRQRFDVFRGGYEYQMQADGSRPTRSAWEAYTQNRCKHWPKVQRRVYRPTLPFGAIVGNAVNMFQPPQVAFTDDPVDPFLDLMKRMLPDDRDRSIVLTWAAAMVQNPGTKFQWSIVLQGTQGNGKTFFLKCLEYAVGEENTHLPNPEDLQEKYNTYIENKLFIGVEEIHMEGRRDVLDRLKKYITNSRLEVRGMRVDKRMTDNLTNWLFLTNYKDAVYKSKDDRRYAIFFTAQQQASDLVRDGMDGDYFPDLWSWARDGGFAAVAGWLRRYACDDRFNPAGKCHRAPDTSSTAAAIEESRGVVEQIVADAIEQGLVGFRDGWVSQHRCAELLEKSRKSVGPKSMAKILEGMGYHRWGRAPNFIMQENHGRPVIYAQARNMVEKFDKYMVSQGYVTVS